MATISLNFKATATNFINNFTLLKKQSISKLNSLLEQKYKRVVTSISNNTPAFNHNHLQQQNNFEEYNFLPINKACKGAIVLCHGLYGYDVKGPKNYPRLQTHYWPGIKESLEKMGNEVIITKVNEIGTIKERAYQLNEQLNKLCKDKQVNLIGHSMGGLDSRYLITHIQEKKYNVLSLTTISTPHRGSYLIDYFLKILNEMKSNTNNNNKSEQETMLSVLTKLYNTNIYMYNLLKYLLNKPAYFNLNCNYMKNYFNPNTPNNPNIKYYSYSTKVDTAPLSNPSLLFPYYVINKYEGINDGVVSVNSAKWGKHLDTINSSHLMVLDETDKNLFTADRPDVKFNSKDLFANISTNLYNNNC